MLRYTHKDAAICAYKINKKTNYMDNYWAKLAPNRRKRPLLI